MEDISDGVCNTVSSNTPALCCHIKKEPTCESESKVLKCNFCEQRYKEHKYLNRHIRNRHSKEAGTTTERKTIGMKCPHCGKLMFDFHSLRNHLELEHKNPIEQECWTFLTMDEFEVWKTGVEEKTHTRYVKRSGAKHLSEDKKKYYYGCNGAGYFKSKATGKYKLKSRTEGSCLSLMVVVKANDKVQVHFWKTHSNHVNPLLLTRTRGKNCLVAMEQELVPFVQDTSEQTANRVKVLMEKASMLIDSMSTSTFAQEDIEYVDKKLDFLLAYIKKLKHSNDDGEESFSSIMIPQVIMDDSN